MVLAAAVGADVVVAPMVLAAAVGADVVVAPMVLAAAVGKVALATESWICRACLLDGR
jgi:hypothetical protein